MVRGQRVIYDLEGLKERLNYWVELLRLHAWDIEVRFFEKDELQKHEGTTAINDYDFHALESLISIRLEEDYEGYGWYDMEFMLLHELLHLVIEVNTPKATADCERAINQMARALLLLNRN